MVDHKPNGVLDVRDKISRYGLSRSLAKEEKYDFYEELLQPSQLEGLTFQNSMEGWILMNFWIGLIWWSMSLSIMIPLNVKK